MNIKKTLCIVESTHLYLCALCIQLIFIFLAFAVINVQEMCDDPGIPINGVRIGNSLSVGSVLFYRCKDGFILLGSKYRKCQENGVFSGMQPTCAPFNGE